MNEDQLIVQRIKPMPRLWWLRPWSLAKRFNAEISHLDECLRIQREEIQSCHRELGYREFGAGGAT